MGETFAEVVFPISLKQVFSYRVPEALQGLAQPGMRCSVSFGRRQTVGLILSTNARPPEKVKALKSIDSLLDIEPSLTKDLMELGKWIADYYYCSIGEALFAAIPTGYRKTSRIFLELLPAALENREKVEEILEEKGPLRGIDWDKLTSGKIPLTPRTKPLMEALKQAGWAALRLSEEGRRQEAPSLKKEVLEKGPELHPQQKKALQLIEESVEKEEFKTFLLQGVTGSGKTEVYLRAIARVLAKGQQAIVLIPEIALTPQTVERFTNRFGDRVAVLHSRLSVGERSHQWRRMGKGEAQVAVGARSALFAPAQRLGLIVVDEEHESSYKQEDSPRYHARDAAVKRAQLCGAVAILGSATPSLESVQNAKSGKYVFLSMGERVNQRPLPAIKIVDLKEEWNSRNLERPILSLALKQAIGETLDRKEQTLLFLNRRGFNTLTLCIKCGEPVHCPSCSIPVTSHRSPQKPDEFILLCHYCNWQGTLNSKCQSCKDGEVKQIGLGTEKVEEEIRSLFPKARIVRMDLDTTRKKGSHGDIIGKFIRRDIDILIGTQMIAKGHDFPGVTLVGIVGADVGLALPDFRSSERVFQLLVQVSGRAGRADKEGVIYLQTFHPEHPSIQAAALHDTAAFMESELELRKALGYPPFSKLGLLVYRGKEDKKVRQFAEKAVEALKKESSALGVSVAGPAPAPLYKLRGHYRYQILMKALKPQPIRKLLERLDLSLSTPPGIFRMADLDPQSML